MVCCDSLLKVYDAVTLNEMPTEIKLNSNATSCAANSQIIAVGQQNGNIMVLSALTMDQIAEITCGTDAVIALDFNLENQLLVAMADNSVRVF